MPVPIVKGDVAVRNSSAVIIAARVLGYAVTVIFRGVSTVVWVSFSGPVTVRVAFSVYICLLTVVGMLMLFWFLLVLLFGV